MRSTQAVLELLRRKGYHVTPQRRVIVDILAGDGTHPTAEQVYQRASAVMPEISRTTVYNTLRELVELGELAPVEDLSDGGTRYDTNTDAHHHLFCVRCNRLVDITLNFAGPELPDEHAMGFKILKGQVTFYGICPDCQRGEMPDAQSARD
ncbi:MAG: Fur family transcriptional regulator [Anaerolineales bacterium]